MTGRTAREAVEVMLTVQYIYLIFMLGQIALSENFTTVPWVLDYICFMRIVVQLIVANYGLTLIRALI